MDVQTLCLGGLTLGEASGYEIKKLFEEGPFGQFYQASYGSIYPALGKLREKNLITMREEEQNGRPNKKVYSITPKGESALARKLKKDPASDKVRSEALVMFFLADFLDPNHLRDVFDSYVSEHRETLDCLNALDDKDVAPHRLFVRGLGRAFNQVIADYMEENRHLLIPDSADLKTGIDQ